MARLERLIAPIARVFRVRRPTTPTVISSIDADRRRLIGRLGVVAMLVVFIGYIFVSLPAPDAVVTDPDASGHPRASVPVSGIECATEPAVTPTPEPSAEPEPEVGDRCAYVSGITVIRDADDNATAQSQQQIQAVLVSLDGGGVLPPDAIESATSGTDGMFALDLYDGSTWRLFAVRALSDGATRQIPITIVRSLGAQLSANTAPSCDSVSQRSQDATIHFAGDVRYIMSITDCGPVGFLANMSTIEIPREDAVIATPAPVLNPVSVSIDYASRLRYEQVAARAQRIATIGQSSPASLIPFLILLAITAVIAATALWVKRRMYALERLPEAQRPRAEAEADDLF